MKKYCVSFGSKEFGCNNKWSIEYTDNLKSYNLTTDKYSKKQVFDTEEEAVSSVRELRDGVSYKKIGY